MADAGVSEAVCIVDLQVSLSLLIRRANRMSPAVKLIVQKFVPFPAVGQSACVILHCNYNFIAVLKCTVQKGTVLVMAALCNRGAIIFLPCNFYFLSSFFSSPNLSGHRLHVYHTLTHGPSANLECRSETCCTRLAANRPTGRKKGAKNRHLGTIAQLRRAISSQLRHVSTIGKKLVKQQYLLHMSP